MLGLNFETTGERAPEKINNTNKKNPKLWQQNLFAVFLPQYKLHKVCADDELRPVFGYIYFKNGNAYATEYAQF